MRSVGPLLLALLLGCGGSSGPESRDPHVSGDPSAEEAGMASEATDDASLEVLEEAADAAEAGGADVPVAEPSTDAEDETRGDEGSDPGQDEPEEAKEDGHPDAWPDDTGLQEAAEEQVGGDEAPDGGAEPGPAPDAAPVDAGLDAGIELQPDVGPDSGVGVPLAGFGAISGECGVLDESVLLGGPALVLNAIDFGTDPYDHPDDLGLLSPGGQVLATTPNAGGSSACSELFAYEVLYRCELAALLQTETEILYDATDTSITDMRVEVDGLAVGVSVTRAVGAPGTSYSYAAAEGLLRKKLLGIQESSSHVVPEMAWVKQVLHVLAVTQGHADFVAQAYDHFASSEPDVLGDTVVVVTVSDGDDEFLYYSCPID